MIDISSTPSVSSFEQELSQLINRHSIENHSNTPDFILASYMIMCLQAFNLAVKTRTNWYKKEE